MKYSGAPAWRNDWALMFIAMFFGIMEIGALSSGEAGVIKGASVMFFGIIALIMWRHFSWKYTIDGDDIISNHGIISRDRKTIRIKDIRNINVSQSFFQRIFGIGDVGFSSAGGAGIEVTFYGIEKPMELESQVNRTRD